MPLFKRKKDKVRKPEKIDLTPIVVDNGSGITKVGYAGDSSPRTAFPTILGKGLRQDSYVGSDAQNSRDVQSIRYPIKRGIITNFDDMEKIWRHTFDNDLHASCWECSILLSEPVHNPKADREKILTIMFETFGFPSVSLTPAPALSLVSSGRLYGCVLECGDGLCQAVPVYSEYSLVNVAQRLEIGGADLTSRVTKLLNERGFSTSSMTPEDFRGIKEKLCYVAQNFDEEVRNNPEPKSYELPDGQSISVGNERFLCPEALFQPNLLGVSGEGVHKLLYNTILKCDADLRKPFFSTITLTGGSTEFPGFVDRITKEITGRVPTAKIDAPADRANAAFIGGSIMASLKSAANQYVSKEGYEEIGPQLVHQICL